MVDEPHYQVGTTASPAEVHEMKEGKLEEKNTDLENSTGTSAVAAEEQESNSNTAVAADLDAQKGMDEPADQSNVEFQANGGPEMNKEGAGNKDADNETQEKDDAQQARQQELDRLLWLYVSLILAKITGLFLGMTRITTIPTQMLKTRLHLCRCQDLRNIQTGGASCTLEMA